MPAEILLVDGDVWYTTRPLLLCEWWEQRRAIRAMRRRMAERLESSARQTREAAHG